MSFIHTGYHGTICSINRGGGDVITFPTSLFRDNCPAIPWHSAQQHHQFPPSCDNFATPPGRPHSCAIPFASCTISSCHSLSLISIPGEDSVTTDDSTTSPFAPRSPSGYAHLTPPVDLPVRRPDSDLRRQANITPASMAPLPYPESVPAQSFPPVLAFLRPSIPTLSSRSVSCDIYTLLCRTSQSLTSISKPLRSLHRRQQDVTAIIPASYAGLNAGPAPGTVAGIVLGSVAGFLLILWLIYTCVNMGPGRSTVVEEEVIRRRSRSPPRSLPRQRSRSIDTRSEVVEVRSPPRRETRRETIVVEETRRPIPVVEREDDIVEVIEEHSPPRRARRNSGRISGGYRTVDPEAFGGGNRPIRKVSGRR